MASELACIAEELRRLQQEGVDRVFVDEATLALLPSGRSAQAEVRTPKSGAATGTINLIDESPTETPRGSGSAQAPESVSPIAPAGLPAPPDIVLPEGDPDAQMAWLRERILQCEVCQSQRFEDEPIVLGRGPVTADLLFCGHAPGQDEIAAGEPFAGEVGTLLTKMIQAMQLSRDAVYLTDIVKWRPYQTPSLATRLPSREEMQFCLPYLRAEIEIIRPKVVVAMGNTAVTGLLALDPDKKFASLRGQWREFAGIPMMITFHPAYLHNNGTRQTKRTAWEDCLQVMEKAGLPISEKQRGYFLAKG